MYVDKIIPIGDDPSVLIADAVAQFLAKFAREHKKNFDIWAGPRAIRVIIAFANYEKTGSVEGFIKELEK